MLAQSRDRLLCCFRRFKSAGGDGMTDRDGKVMEEDEDVSQERRRVLRGSGRRDLLQLKNLSKVGHFIT